MGVRKKKTLVRPKLLKVEVKCSLLPSLTPLLVDQILHLALWARDFSGSFTRGEVHNCLIFTKTFINHDNN